MQRSTPQPDDFDARQQARQAGLARPKPPRVIVSGDEAEDASEWEVVVVENEAIDDERALEIARQRHQQQRLANLPSLDERDIAQALGIGTEGEAEAADGIDSDAFVLPDDTPPARRIVGPAPMPVGLIFDGVEEPGEESPGEDASAHFNLEDPPEPESLDEVRFADPDPDPEPDGVDPELAVDLEAGVEPAAGDEQHLPVTSWNPAPLEPRVTFDDVDLGFYDIGDEAIDAPVIPDEVPEAAPEEAAGLDRDDETVPNDDPHHDFYAVDDKDPVTALEPPKPKEVVPPTEPVKLWGTGRAKQVDGKVYAPGEVPPDEVIPEDDDDFASSFPIDPDEFLTEEGAEVDVNELDYASVFGPVDAPSALTPVPVAAPVHDLDPMEVAAHAPITESPARRRRRN
ncbi:MAG: hypothetical protein M3Z03_05730, partial [Actinomycetota bacterium]|nr:hypothetical protein [Actinomycetota bacterium]